jgi:hypothetical protein
MQRDKSILCQLVKSCININTGAINDCTITHGVKISLPITKPYSHYVYEKAKVTKDNTQLTKHRLQ